MTNQTYNDVVNLSSTILRETLDGLTAVYSGVEQAKLYMFWETEDEAEEPGIKVCDFGYGMRGSWCEGIGHLGGGWIWLGMWRSVRVFLYGFLG